MSETHSPSSRHVFLAFTNPIEEREAQFNAWYDRSHVPELLRWGKGFVGARRYRLAAVDGSDVLPPWKYLALYELRIDDPASLSETWIVDGAPPMTPFAGLLKHDHAGWIYTPCSSRIARPELPQPEASPFLCLHWSTAEPPDDATLRASLDRSPAVASAAAFVLAAAQRGNQPASPWRGLVIEERQVPDLEALFDSDTRWLFAALGEYRSRDDVVAGSDSH